jgi:Nif-specific regulatory protein
VLPHEAVSPPEIQSSEKLLAVLRICQQMSAVEDLSALLDMIAREAARLIEADRSAIFLLDREKEELWSKIAMGSDEVLRFDARLGIAGAVIATGRTINASEAHQHPDFYPGIDAHTGYYTRTLLATPLRNFDGEVTGAFEVLNKRDGQFTEADEEILKALAAQAAIAIETAQTLEKLRQHRDHLLRENTRLWKEVEGRFTTRTILGTSDRIRAVVKLIEQVSDSSVDVLITGESGTGKELVARAIHHTSPRARRPFVALNCAALPENLVESELFGIEEGVATGVRRRIGKFEEANTGTLFLDEVGDLSPTTQAKLLRVLQERVIERVGGGKAIPVDVRILTATNRDLTADIRSGAFRPDLYYRLNVIRIHMPSLREIPGDIPLLAEAFLARHCQEMKRVPMTLTAVARETLMRYSWPGNVRELDNEIKRLVVSVGRPTIDSEELSETIRSSGGASVQLVPAASSLKQSVADLERQMILEALERCRHNQQRAARVLGLSRQGLIKKMHRYGSRLLHFPKI